MRAESQVGTEEETPLLTHIECEPLSQSGCSVSVPAVRAWCLLPVKLDVSAAASARMVPVQDLFFFSLFCLGTLGTFSLSSCFFFFLPAHFFAFFASLSLRSLCCLRQYRRVPSNKSASLSLRGTRLQTSLLVSVSLLMVLRFSVKCVGGEKNLFFVKKNDNLSFFQTQFSACRDGFALCSVTECL